MRPDLLVEIAELPVAVRVLPALDHLGVGLRTETLLVQQVNHRVRADRMPLDSQRGGQSPGGFRRPPQRRAQIAPLLRLDQRQQRRHQTRISLGQPLATRARGPHPAQRLDPGLQLAHPPRDRPLPHPRRTGHQPDPAIPQPPSRRPGQQPPLPLIQMRTHLREHRRQPHQINTHRHTHTRSTSNKTNNDA
jgi:hypothetical protein